MKKNRFEEAEKLIKEGKGKRMYRDTATYRFESSSNPGEHYDVNLTYKCSCPDFQYNKRVCKHIIAAARMLSQEG